MGKIRRPHIVVLAEEFPRSRTQPVVLKGRPHVALHILARLERQALRIRNLRVHMIEALDPIGYPAHVVFGRYDLELGETFEDSAINQSRDALLDDVDDMNLEV